MFFHINRKLLLIILILLAPLPSLSQVVIGKKGGIIADQEKCPKNITCPTDELLGDDGHCYKCTDERSITVLCDADRAKKSCPNRYLAYGEYTTLNESVIHCPKNSVPENGICRNKRCEDFEGFHSTSHGCCPIVENEIIKENQGNEIKVMRSCFEILY